MAPRTDRTTRIPCDVASPATTHHAAKGLVFDKLRNAGNGCILLPWPRHSFTIAQNPPLREQKPPLREKNPPLREQPPYPRCKITGAMLAHVPTKLTLLESGGEDTGCVQGTSPTRNLCPPQGPPEEPRHGPTVGSYGVAFFYKRGERKHGLSIEQFPVSAYVGSSKNLKDLKEVPLQRRRNASCGRLPVVRRHPLGPLGSSSS